MPIERRWLTIPEVASLFSVHRKTAYDWAARGGILPTVRIGGALRVDRLKLEKNLERQLEKGR